ncbi:unnamed protein product [Arabidopsis halleri]
MRMLNRPRLHWKKATRSIERGRKRMRSLMMHHSIASLWVS